MQLSEVDHRVARCRNLLCVNSVRNTLDEVGLADWGAIAQEFKASPVDGGIGWRLCENALTDMLAAC
jgi:hypothetical protein